MAVINFMNMRQNLPLLQIFKNDWKILFLNSTKLAYFVEHSTEMLRLINFFFDCLSPLSYNTDSGYFPTIPITTMF
jgi:hypothetical protein